MLARRNTEPLNRTPPPLEAGRDGLVWLIRELVDTGPSNWYRYRVRGEIWDQGAFVGELSWHIPDVDDPYFYVPCGRQFDAARAALAKARGEGCRD